MTDLEHAEVDAPAVRPGAEGRDLSLGWRRMGMAFLIFLAGLVLSQIAVGIVVGIRGEELVSGRTPSQPVTSAGQLGLALAFVGIPLFLLGRQTGLRGPDGAFDRLGLRARWVDLPLGIGVGIGSTILTTLLYLPFSAFTSQEDLEKPAREMVDAARHVQGGVALLVLSVCVLAPIAEEVFFRGVLFRASSRLVGLWPGIALAGVLFGLVHFELLQLAGLAVFGMVLCYLFHRTGRLGACIVAHVVFNAVTVVQLLSR